eukprot:gene7298-biopygen13570
MARARRGHFLFPLASRLLRPTLARQRVHGGAYPPTLNKVWPQSSAPLRGILLRAGAQSGVPLRAGPDLPLPTPPPSGVSGPRKVAPSAPRAPAPPPNFRTRFARSSMFSLCILMHDLLLHLLHVRTPLRAPPI